MKQFHGAIIATLILAGTVACNNDSNTAAPPELPTPASIVSAAGVKDTVLADLTAFKAALGGANNNATPGTQPTGFRAVNWDAVADSLTQKNTFAAQTFANRGLFMQTPGTGFRVDTAGFVAFPNVAPGQFPPFSGNKLFASIGNPEMDALFNVPGNLSTPARVSAFGVVFVDNELAHSATIEAFDGQGRSLGVFSAPVTASGQFSFVGVTFDSAIVARVRITSGTDALGAAAEGAGNGVDLVAMDDFVYGEPQGSN